MPSPTRLQLGFLPLLIVFEALATVGKGCVLCPSRRPREPGEESSVNPVRMNRLWDRRDSNLVLGCGSNGLHGFRLPVGVP